MICSLLIIESSPLLIAIHYGSARYCNLVRKMTHSHIMTSTNNTTSSCKCRKQQIYTHNTVVVHYMLCYCMIDIAFPMFVYCWYSKPKTTFLSCLFMTTITSLFVNFVAPLLVCKPSFFLPSHEPNLSLAHLLIYILVYLFMKGLFLI